MLRGMDSLMQGFRRVIIQHGHGLLADDGAGINPGIHEMHGAPGYLYPVIERLLPGFQPGEGWQQGGVD